MKPEIFDALRRASSPEELCALAKEKGISLSEKDADFFFTQFQKTELSDDELDNVAGGGICDPPCPSCGHKHVPSAGFSYHADTQTYTKNYICPDCGYKFGFDYQDDGSSHPR